MGTNKPHPRRFTKHTNAIFLVAVSTFISAPGRATLLPDPLPHRHLQVKEYTSTCEWILGTPRPRLQFRLERKPKDRQGNGSIDCQALCDRRSAECSFLGRAAIDYQAVGEGGVSEYSFLGQPRCLREDGNMGLFIPPACSAPPGTT